MPLQELVNGANPARDDVQQTSFSYDVLGRYICNNWQEVTAAQGPGSYPFDAIVIGAGMYGAYCAEKLYRSGASAALRILMLDAGAFLLPSHIQNLPQQLGGKVGGPNYLRKRDDASGAQNVIWGMPWISNEAFPGLAYCIGGRSLFWGGWSPPLTAADLANWPNDLTAFLTGATGYPKTEEEIGTSTTTDFITKTALFNALQNGIQAALPLDGITEVSEAPLAVQGAAPRSGLFAFDKFSSAPFVMDALRNDVSANTRYGDLSRRIFLVPRVQVHRLNVTGICGTRTVTIVVGHPAPYEPLHVTGIAPIDADFVATVRQADLPTAGWERLIGRSVDHMAFSETDWTFMDWAFEQLRAGAWGKPWIASLEYGGIGRIFQAFCDAEVLAEVVPRLYGMVQAI